MDRDVRYPSYHSVSALVVSLGVRRCLVRLKPLLLLYGDGGRSTRPLYFPPLTKCTRSVPGPTVPQPKSYVFRLSCPKSLLSPLSTPTVFGDPDIKGRPFRLTYPPDPSCPLVLRPSRRGRVLLYGPTTRRPSEGVTPGTSGDCLEGLQGKKVSLLLWTGEG